MKSLITAPWAILPEKLMEIQEIYLHNLHDIAGAEARAGIFADRPPAYENKDDRAIIPVIGPVTKKPNVFTWLFGGSASQIVAQSLQSALMDDGVKSIILYIDSPGGTVDGTQELAREIFNARGKKPIVAYTDGMLASAAYWIGAAADKIYISGDTTQVGSIGVVARHIDVSKYEESLGVKTSEVVAGRYKGVASQYRPLSDIGRQSIQDAVDYVYNVFLGDISLFRGLSLGTVKEGNSDTILWADGRIFLGRQAIEAGLADGQISYDDLLRADLEKLVRQPRLRLANPLKTASMGEAPTQSAGAVAAPVAQQVITETVAAKVAALKKLADPATTFAEKVLLIWKSNPEIRREFRNNLASFEAWQRNKERIVIVKDRVIR